MKRQKTVTTTMPTVTFTARTLRDLQEDRNQYELHNREDEKLEAEKKIKIMKNELIENMKQYISKEGGFGVFSTDIKEYMNNLYGKYGKLPIMFLDSILINNFDTNINDNFNAKDYTVSLPHSKKAFGETMYQILKPYGYAKTGAQIAAKFSRDHKFGSGKKSKRSSRKQVRKRLSKRKTLKRKSLRKRSLKRKSFK
jgi:hypothetical protein